MRIVEDQSLNVLTTIRRAGPQEGSHVLRLRSGSQEGGASRRGERSADYLIVFECRMALLDGTSLRAVLRDNSLVREQVIRDCGALHRICRRARRRIWAPSSIAVCCCR